jgi:hypothetical protein
MDDADSPARCTVTIRSFSESIPTKLPPAKLYLDDITEIWQILTDSSPECQASFVAGRAKCDTLDDLKDLGGRTTHFVMDISAPGKHQTLELTTSSTRIHIHELGDQLAAWSKYVNVAAIFEKRRLRLKSVVRAVGWRIFAGLWLLTVALWMFFPHALKPLPAYELPRLATGILIAGAVAYYFASSQSIVYLRSPRKVGAGGWLAEHKPEIIVGAICILTGAIASRILEKIWK